MLCEVGAAPRKGGGGRGGSGGGSGGGQGGQGQGQKPAATQDPKFKDLSVSTGFYFASDDAKTYRWIKLSDTKASNTVNQVVADVAADTVIKR